MPKQLGKKQGEAAVPQATSTAARKLQAHGQAGHAHTNTACWD